MSNDSSVRNKIAPRTELAMSEIFWAGRVLVAGLKFVFSPSVMGGVLRCCIIGARGNDKVLMYFVNDVYFD